MNLRWIPGLLLGLFVLALIGVPALALRPLAEAPDASLEPPAPAAEQAGDPQAADEPAEEDDDEGLGSCQGIQRAYWAVTSNPGLGDGKEEAATQLAQLATERGCELSDSPPEGWRGGPPSWAGRDDAGADDDGDAAGKGRRGPKWAGAGDGPPWGMAWGHWLEHDVEDACARIAVRMEAHPNASVPEDLRERIENELGCDLP